MSLQQQMRLMTLITIVGLSLVIIFVSLTLSSLRNELIAYQSAQLVDKNLIEIKATALTISCADPILLETQSRLQQTDERIHDLYSSIASLTQNPAGLAGVAALIKSWDEYAKGFFGAIKIASDSPLDALQIPDALYKSTLGPMVSDLDHIVTKNQAQEIELGDKIKSDMNQVLWIVLVPLILAGSVVILFQLLFNRGLKKRVDDISEVVGHLHRGDLIRRLPAASDDEISQMAKTINRFIARFESILRDVHVSADQTKKTAHGISAMTTSVTFNAREQSDKVNEVSSAVEEMGNTIREIASNAASAATASNQAMGLVKTGVQNGTQHHRGAFQNPGHGQRLGHHHRRAECCHHAHRLGKQCDQGYCRANQFAGAKRRDRSGARRRAGARFCSGCG